MLYTSGFNPGNQIYISGAGNFQVSSIINSISTNIVNLGGSNAAGPGQFVSSGLITTLYGAPYPMSVNPINYFGDGGDGDFIILSNVNTSLSRDQYYRNVFWQSAATGVITLNQCRIFVNGVLDLTNCPANGIIANTAGTASSASGATGGNTDFPLNTSVFGLVGGVQAGGAGATATTGVGTIGFAGNAFSTLTIGGGSGNGGAGGTSGVNVGGIINTASTITTPYNYIYRKYTDILSVNNGLQTGYGGAGGFGGSAGGGSGVSAGGGGGAGGYGGYNVQIYARTIIRPRVQKIIISSTGRNGGAGAAGTAANTGGGGGGGPQLNPGGNGGSGIIVIAYLTP
jgi:hypothetical protein